jgi:hypothetical protein
MARRLASRRGGLYGPALQGPAGACGGDGDGEDQGGEPLVELDGGEMARIMWSFIKNQLIRPDLDIELKYYELGMESRESGARRCKHVGSRNRLDQG